MSVTFDTFQPLIFELNNVAPSKVLYRFVTLETSQLLMSLLNVDLFKNNSDILVIDADGPFRGLHSSDIDMDGDKDIIIANSTNIRWFKNNNGNISFGGFVTNDDPFSFITTDYDNDGDVDIVAVLTTQTVFLYKNDGNGNFSSSELISYSDLPEEPYLVLVEDMNDDSHSDIIITGYFVCG